MDNYVITISRELGSGGAYFGKKLASELNIMYVDRDILTKAAEKLKLSKEELEYRDEKVTSFWQSLVMSYAKSPYDTYIPPQIYIPSDVDFYKAESQIVSDIAEKQSCVIVGHGGSFVLKNHKRHLSIFLHADKDFRVKRLMEIYKVTEKKARELIKESDKDRLHYYNMLSGNNWFEALQYDLCIDTGKMNFDTIEEVIMQCIKSRFE